MVPRCFIVALLFAAGSLHAENGALIQANQQKLNTIVLPDLNFQNLTLQQALDQINKFANAQANLQSGVNFVLQAPNPAPTITLVMKTPTLGQALNEIAKQAHLKIVAQQYAIVLMPADAAP